MNKKERRILCVFFFCFLFITKCGIAVNAQRNYEKQYEQYRVEIIDDACLFSVQEMENLYKTMEKITAYGNVACVTTYNADFSTEEYAATVYKYLFGTDSGTLFLIDMDNRYIWIYSDGAIYQTITQGYANTITDNVYRLASDGEYYACANEAFSQILTLLEGGKIAQPMKYICNAILGFIVAVLINFCFVVYGTRMKRTKNKELLEGIQHYFHYTDPAVVYTHETREEISTSSRGGRSGRVGGSGGFRGGRSGGGGGHRF